MNRRALGIVAFIVVMCGVLLWLAPPGGSRTVTDVTPLGYRLAFAWLAERGDVATWEGPELPEPGTTLVVTFPVETPIDDEAGLLAWVSAGGRLVLLLNGTGPGEPPFSLVEAGYGVTITREDPAPPYDRAEWMAWEEARRHATTSSGRILLARPGFYLTCPEGARTLARGEDGATRVCAVSRGAGEVVVIVDASVWQNDTLAAADNLAFLDEVLGGRIVRFDQLHHVPDGRVGSVPAAVPAALFAQLGALWLVGALTLARRFGDPLPPSALPGPSMARALRALATLHRGAGHAHDAAAALYGLAVARAARAGVPAERLPPPPSAPSDAAFAEWAGRLGRELRELRV